MSIPEECKEVLKTLDMIGRYVDLQMELSELKAEIDRRIEIQKQRRAVREGRN